MSCPQLNDDYLTKQHIPPGPLVVVIMDGIGIGIGKADAGDAVAHAHAPMLAALKHTSLYCELSAHGTAVGMPSDADMGNSEVGHNAIGAGRIFEQGAKLVAQAIASGQIFASATWQTIEGQCISHHTALHCIGLLSDGNVHSHIDHLLAIIKRADAAGIERLFVHALLDGRDVAPTSALHYVEQLEGLLAHINLQPNRLYAIASGGGRMQLTMDRYQADWSMLERGYAHHVLGIGTGFASARAAIDTYRAQQPGIGDQNLPGFVIHKDGKPIGRVQTGDAMLAFNFRGDRMLEWVQVCEDAQFTAFKRGPKPDILFAGMTLYDGDTKRPQQYLVEPPHIACTLSELLCHAGIKQLACSETQKFGHVTYFWNGNHTGMFDKKLETYIEVPSLLTPFDAQPQMQALAITEVVGRAIANQTCKFARLNFANGDMVGHTGNFSATVKAVETVDQCIARLWHVVNQQQGCMIITADHGNAEEMLELGDKGVMYPKTSHTRNPVPFGVMMHKSYAPYFKIAKYHKPGLANIANTILTLLGFQQTTLFLPGLLDTTTPATHAASV